jgi:C_GCAxxG_C_C family probable redox protein
MSERASDADAMPIHPKDAPVGAPGPLDPGAKDDVRTRIALEEARRLYLDERHEHGCAETVYLALAGAFGLEVAGSGPAMALNGGVAYAGGICGAISGSAMALGSLAEQRIPDHREAKRVARELTARLMDRFQAEHGAVDCRALIGLDLRAPGQHEAFLAGDLWRDRCLRQIETAIRHLAPLASTATWDRAVRALDEPV